MRMYINDSENVSEEVKRENPAELNFTLKYQAAAKEDLETYFDGTRIVIKAKQFGDTVTVFSGTLAEFINVNTSPIDLHKINVSTLTHSFAAGAGACNFSVPLGVVFNLDNNDCLTIEVRQKAIAAADSTNLIIETVEGQGVQMCIPEWRRLTQSRAGQYSYTFDKPVDRVLYTGQDALPVNDFFDGIIDDDAEIISEGYKVKGLLAQFVNHIRMTNNAPASTEIQHVPFYVGAPVKGFTIEAEWVELGTLWGRQLIVPAGLRSKINQLSSKIRMKQSQVK